MDEILNSIFPNITLAITVAGTLLFVFLVGGLFVLFYQYFLKHK